MKTSCKMQVPVQFFGFVAVGALNTLWAYALFALFIYVGLHYAVATLFAGLLTVLSGYTAHRRFVFVFRGDGRLSRFAAAFAVIYLVNIGIQRFLLGAGWGNEYAAGAIATAVCALLGFWINKRLVFR